MAFLMPIIDPKAFEINEESNDETQLTNLPKKAKESKDVKINIPLI